MGICERSGPCGQHHVTVCPRAHAAPARPAGSSRRELFSLFPPFGAGVWPAARAAGLHLGGNMEQGGRRRRGRRLRRLRVPACSSGSGRERGERCIPGSQTSMRHVGLTACCAPRQRHWGPAGPQHRCASPSLRVRTDPSLLLPLACTVALLDRSCLCEGLP